MALLEKLTQIARENGIEGDPLEDDRLAHILDEKDELAEFRGKFHIPPKRSAVPKEEAASMANGDEPSIYLCGNSLGLQPKATRERIIQELDDWQNLGVEGHWNAKYPWLTADECVTTQVSRYKNTIMVKSG